MLPWLLLLVVGNLFLIWPPLEGDATLLRWTWMFTAHTAFVLPFVLFAAGVALTRRLGYSRQIFRVGALVGISVVAASYLLGSWLAPELDDRYLATLGIEMEDTRRFGARTPVGVVRNLRFVEANPPEEYGLRASTPHRFPPNVLRWALHSPVAVAVFGLFNVVIGILSAELTIALARGSRRNARIVIGVLGGMAFYGCYLLAGPMEPFLQDGTTRSGVASAWAPLVLPAAECLILGYLVRRRRYG
ncbi:MAG: hypothetical protein F4139_13125 [Gemmatimonadetes bacterium]|nr:hypothetical protein [Gemmatimonadota bacterium]MYA64789.1 hypothetical protein [Gemmatimonadota bacterium]MYB98218.1 hypothetical protein [Gemmatimonadota bacterium]MYH53864.1 hypothetical protein [Gemmatimonadota bacterium]MYI44961.1 hypothetical protein [Gemmatimonadota bacterium]